jgi:hypothetical protein
VDPSWRNLDDVDVVVLHYWIEERLPVASVDPDTRLVTTSRASTFSLVDDVGDRYARYYLDNVFEALSEPGEWYLDRTEGTLYYLPREGETPAGTEVVAPRTTQFVRVAGDPDAGAYVEDLRFEGLTFRHADWEQADPGEHLDHWSEHYGGGKPYATVPQAAFHLPGAITMEGALGCAVEDCVVEHVGWYGIELGDGCRGNRVVGTHVHDTGGGGVKTSGADADGPRARRTGDNRIADNHLHDGGRVFHSAIGVLVRHAYETEVVHNHVHDYFYSGISVGWVWGYDEHVARDNRIEKNHVHDLGKGLLSDMGGIYTLGVQPGSVVRGNLIHDVERRNYGGWAIYPDEGSSHLLIENNVAYDTSSQPFHQHYGRENVVRNNVFALGGEGQVVLTRFASGRTGETVLDDGAEYVSFTFERNVVLTDDQPVFVGRRRLALFEDGNDDGADANGDGEGEDGTPAKRAFRSDCNLFWNVSGEDLTVGVGGYDEEADWVWEETYPFERWRALGQDRHSVVAEPGVFDPETREVDVATVEGAAAEIGFEPIDLSDVGPRPPGER